jgi:uncharacterized protein YqjF (DUF2071 family)
MRCYAEFLEFNVRTYSVDSRGRRSVVFLTIERDRLTWGPAAHGARLPYGRAHRCRDTSSPAGRGADIGESS